MSSPIVHLMFLASAMLVQVHLMSFMSAVLVLDLQEGTLADLMGQVQMFEA